MSDALSIDDYSASIAEESKRISLLVASILGDLRDDIVIVGGLVPYLTVDQSKVDELHIGTRDLDLGLSLAFLDNERYKQVSKRLREHGFGPSLSDKGNPSRQTWEHSDYNATIDFLIPPAPADGEPTPGKLKSLEGDFAAWIADALPLAFLDFEMVRLDEEIEGLGRTEREVKVCGAGAFVALKAHAIDGRVKFKDAYDLVYILTNHREAIDAIGVRLRRLGEQHESAAHAIKVLRRDFASVAHTGPVRYATFFGDATDDERRAEAFAVVQALLRFVDSGDPAQSLS